MARQALVNRLVVAGSTLAISLVVAVGVAWACTPSANLSVTPQSAPAGSAVTVSGNTFPDWVIELRLDGEHGALLKTTHGPFFSEQVTIPPTASPGVHYLIAVGRNPDGIHVGTKQAVIEVTAAPASGARGGVSAPQVPRRPASPLADTVGPAVSGAALTLANGALTVSRRRSVTLFCGRFAENVTGRCGAKSARRLGSPGSRSAPLTLRSKSFTAESGRPVRLTFRLTRKSMRLLARAKRVRMRGRVVAGDARANRSTAGFRFTLKAPGSAGRSSAVLAAW